MKSNEFQNVIFVIGTRGFPNIQGGIETHCQNLYSELDSLGIKTVVFTRSPYVSGLKSWTTFNGVSLKKIWTIRSKYLENIVHSFLALFYTKIYHGRIVHIHGIGAGLVIPIAKILGFTIFFTHHGRDYERKKWGGISKRLLQLGEYFAIQYSDLLFAVSHIIQRDILESYRKNSIYLPNGGFISDGSMIENDKKMAAQYPIDSYYLCVGRLVPEKGFETAILAFKNSLDGKILIIIGDSDHRSEYSENLKKTSTQNIVFLGKLDHSQTLSMIKNAKAVIVPSYFEGLPIIVLEALSLGTLVIVSDIEPNREIIENNRFGFYFRSGDYSQLQSIVQSIEKKSKKEIDELRVSAKTFVNENYNWKTIAQKYKESVSSVFIYN